MPNILFRFVRQVASLAQKLTDAALLKVSDPAGTDLPAGSTLFCSISENTWKQSTRK